MEESSNIRNFNHDPHLNVVIGVSLLWRAHDELNTLGNVTTEALVCSLEQLLLVLVCIGDHIDGFLRAIGTELNRHREEVTASKLLDISTAFHARQVNVGWSDNPTLTLEGLDDILGEAVQVVSSPSLVLIVACYIPKSSVGHG